MTTIKRHALLLACLLIVAVLCASMAWHCTHRNTASPGATLGVQIGKSTAPGGTLTPDAGTPATTTFDWSLIGQAAGALMAGVVGVWQLLRKRDIAGAVAVGQQLISGAERLRETIKSGAPLQPSAEVLGDDLLAFTTGTGSGPAYELAMRVAGEKLLAKYVITVRP